MHAVPPVTHGSAAVRIGGLALTYLLAQAASNGCTARVAAETIILDHQCRTARPAPEPSLGAAVLEQTAAGVDPIEAAVQVVTAGVKKARRVKTGVGTPVGAPAVESRASRRKARLTEGGVQ